MPRTPIIVTLADGKDHLIVDGEVTGCGQIVPPGQDWVAEDSTTKPCPICFPETKAKSKKSAEAA
jgi:hypothetical protein